MIPRDFNYSIDDLELDPQSVFGVESAFDDQVPPAILGSGALLQNATLQDGYIQSSNYQTGVDGWRLSPDTAEFNVGVTVDSIDIPDAVTANSFHVDTNGNMWIGATTFAAPAPFRVANTGSLDVGGTDASSWHVDSAGNMWWGSGGSYAAASVKISNAGVAAFSSMTITGGAISSTPISSIPNDTSTDISLLEKTWTMTFSVTDLNTVAWSSGTITLSNGRTFSISSGNTGNMAALTYIYLDPAVSITVLQTTTTASTALGANKCLIGTAQNNSVTASFIPYGPGQPLVDGANIGALSITASNIAATTITAGKLTVSTLSAISADLGTITAGTVTGATLRTASSGSRFQMTSTAFQGINSSGTVIFEVIISGANAGDVIMGDDASGSYAMWDDSAGTFNVYADNIAGANKTVYTSGSGNWSKPTGAQFVFLQMWGGGGAGGGVDSVNDQAGGGGGGAYLEVLLNADDLGGTVAYSVAASVSGGTGTGSAGNNSTFGTYTAYGGGGGGGGNSVSSGGGGGGIETAGSNGSTSGASASGGNGGEPIGGAGGSSSAGGTSVYGGGGGGSGNTTGAGGRSVKGGGGGGGTSSPGSAGGKSYYGGGGGGGGGAGVGAGSGGTSVFGGAGGSGGSNAVGSAGTSPGGGGGGAGDSISSSRNGGNGAAGRIIVTAIF